MKILFIVLFFSSVAFGQANDIYNKRNTKNILLVNIGSTIYFFHNVGLKYQRIFLHEKINSALTIGQDFLYADFFRRDNVFTTSLKYGIITKTKNNNPHHFEINTGIGFIHNKVISRNNGIPYSYGSYGAGPSETEEPLSEPVNERNYFSIVGNLGYRYQSKENSTVFKFGVGFPELLHIGLGVSF